MKAFHKTGSEEPTTQDSETTIMQLAVDDFLHCLFLAA